MKSRPQPSLSPIKTPVQARSTATVEAILQATIQVLLSAGAARLTTTRVAERAGVSVGTLYQYYPNKQSLLFAILKRHLTTVFDAVERACKQNHHRPLDEMVEAVVHALLDAKLSNKETSLALYAVAPDLNGQALVAELTKKAQRSMCAMLKTAPGLRFSQIEFTVSIFFTAMAGVTRAFLEGGASKHMEESLRRHLVLLGQSYFNTAFTHVAISEEPLVLATQPNS
jgi:AcrR family transcriptional regulator